MTATDTNPDVTPETHVPLDEVMLAMDVVDTLRHQQAMVEAELGEDERRQRLIDRIRSIYESQGMEVSEEVIAEGVKALEEDRFTYEPPERGLQVRLAEVYVERGKWAKRTLIVVLIGVALWLAYAIPAHLHRQSLIEGFQRQVAIVVAQKQQLDRQVSRLQERIAAARSSLKPDSPVGGDILAGAERSLASAGRDLAGLGAWLEPGPDPEDYPEARETLDGELEQQRKVLSSVQSDLGAANGQLQSLLHLLRIPAELARVFAKLKGIPVGEKVMADLDRQRHVVNAAVETGKVKEAEQGLRQLEGQVDAIVSAHHQRAARESLLSRLQGRLQDMALDDKSEREVAGLVARVQQALRTHDDREAAQALAALDSLVTELDLSYELRIATRGRSGVWRKKNNDPRIRNYYIIVEAIDNDGRRLSLRIRNEETGKVHKVRSFGVRVPESVYEKVKKDKLDNGIVDNKLFGKKKRGTRNVDYFFEVEGGRITRW